MTARPSCTIFRIATILCFSGALAQAGDGRDSIPIFSGGDGSSARVEISHAGNRATAVPVLEISGKTVNKLSTAGEKGIVLPEPHGKGEGKEAVDGADVGDLLKRHKSLVIREGPEGVSIGNAFDLMGDIQYVLKKGRRSQEKMEAVVHILEQKIGDSEPVAPMAERGEMPVVNLSGESGPFSAGCVRPCLVNR